MSDNAPGATIVLQTEGVRIPGILADLESFRRWTRSDAFPDKGRIDWIGGEVEIDMSPEDVNRHGTLKGAISRVLGTIVEGADRGVVLIDSTRLCVTEVGLSVEPDVMVVFFETVDSGRVRLVPSAGGLEAGIVEVEGAPDVVVECVSPSSRTKDWERLREHYWRAGIAEYWVADACRSPLRLVIFRRAGGGYEETPADAEGFSASARLGLSFRLIALPPRSGLVRYRLESR